MPHEKTARTGHRMKTARKRAARATHSLVGKWFHTFKVDVAGHHIPPASMAPGREASWADSLHWQGQVLKEVSPGLLLVQLYSWETGAPTDQKIIPVTEMVKGWQFYDSDQDMNFAYEQRIAPKQTK
jgi:hypothetical protein